MVAGIINLFPRYVFTFVDFAGSVISIFDPHAFEWNGVEEVDNRFQWNSHCKFETPLITFLENFKILAFCVLEI